MSGINPYGSSLLNGLFGQNTNTTSVQSAQIIDAPTSLKNLATNLILKGEVVAQNAGREAVISTDRGEIIVRLKNDLPVGSKVDIQIPSGQQAKEVIIQPTLAKAIQQNQLAQPQTQNQVQVQKQISQPTIQVQVKQTAQTAPTATIADVKNLQATATQATQNITNTLSNFNIGQAVRITPLPPAQQNGLALQNFTTSTPLPVTITSSIRPLPLSSHVIPQSFVTVPQPIPTPATPRQNLTAQPIRIPSNVTITMLGAKQLESHPPQISRQVLQTPMPPTATQGQPTQTPIVEISPVRVRLGTPITMNVSSTIPKSTTLPTTQPIPKAVIATTQTPAPVQSDARLTTLTTPTVQINSSTTQTQNTTPQQPPFSLTNGQARAGQIVATATGFMNTDGNPIIQTVGANNQIQLSTLHYPAKNLPAGTQITLNPIGSSNIPIAKQPSQSWQNMAQFIDEMTSVFPAITTQSLMQLIPNTAQPKSFPAAAVLFLAAAKGGDLSGWLGTKITRPNDNGQAISKKIIDTLMRDVATQSGRTATPSDPPMVQANADWRGHVLPLILGADVQQAMLWAKDDEGSTPEKDDDKKIGGTRFVVDLKLSRMGDVYFDGLIHPEKQTFDLALITQRQISYPMQNTIKSIWYKTLGGLGLDGVITFKDTA